jgi:ribose 5-phosphate isomerase A
MVEDGMRLGLGTGSTVAYLLEALGERSRELRAVRCAATSPATAETARALGLAVHSLDELVELDLAIDGADQIDPAGWLVKGRGGALTREKIAASAARRFVVIASAEKPVQELSPPVPVELMRFGLHSTLRALSTVAVRDAPPSPDGGVIADYVGSVSDPPALASRLSQTPGVVEHGLFAPHLVSVILIASEDGVERRCGAKDAPSGTGARGR